MASGGIRYDFTTEENFTQNENRRLHIPVKDENGDPVVSFVGWEFTFYLKTQLKDADASALITKSTLTTGIPAATAPDVYVDLLPADTTSLGAKTYWYELWRTDSDDRVRLAWGQFPIIN
jgi:hypothetical protein